MKKITVIGGDDRLKVVERELAASNYAVDTIGLYENDCGSVEDSIAVVFPVPTTKDKKTVYTPLTHRRILLSDIADRLSRNQLVLCCNYRFENLNCIDYGALDSYSLLNAVPTAEGAIKLAIENTPYTLWQSRVLVVGYGRVGKILADRLKAMGCKVTVSARKPADFALLEALGFNSVNTGNLNFGNLDYDIIFNTVDVKVISDTALKGSGSSLLIDLSSKGGFSIDAATDAGIKAIKAPGLPGIVAPQTAGNILSKTITELINSYN